MLYTLFKKRGLIRYNKNKSGEPYSLDPVLLDEICHDKLWHSVDCQFEIELHSERVKRLWWKCMTWSHQNHWHRLLNWENKHTSRQTRIYMPSVMQRWRNRSLKALIRILPKGNYFACFIAPAEGIFMLNMSPSTGRGNLVLDNSIQTHLTASPRILFEWSLTHKRSAIWVCVPAEFVSKKPHSFSSLERMPGLATAKHSVTTSERSLWLRDGP